MTHTDDTASSSGTAALDWRPGEYRTVVAVQAARLTDDDAVWAAVAAWCGGVIETRDGGAPGLEPVAVLTFVNPNGILEAAELGDWIVRGVAGFFLVDADLFEVRYEHRDQHLIHPPAPTGGGGPWLPFHHELRTWGPDDPLTEDEARAAVLAGQLWDLVCQLVPAGPSRDADLAELRGHVHIVQRAVLAQAAARVYPDLFRQLGEGSPLPLHQPVSPAVG